MKCYPFSQFSIRNHKFVIKKVMDTYHKDYRWTLGQKQWYHRAEIRQTLESFSSNISPTISSTTSSKVTTCRVTPDTEDLELGPATYRKSHLSSTTEDLTHQFQSCTLKFTLACMKITKSNTNRFLTSTQSALKNKTHPNSTTILIQHNRHVYFTYPKFPQ